MDACVGLRQGRLFLGQSPTTAQNNKPPTKVLVDTETGIIVYATKVLVGEKRCRVARVSK